MPAKVRSGFASGIAEKQEKFQQNAVRICGRKGVKQAAGHRFFGTIRTI